MLQYQLSTSAQSDIIDILAWTHRQFGEVARKRYEALIVAALRDIAAQPDRVGSIKRPELGEAVRSWHLSLSRERARFEGGIVRNPRHFIIYRQQSALIMIARVLHEAMELARHLKAETSWE
ncbi:type II toxin-antitoxin system RelE/ParE family toxin [Paenalcaligenes niemegkensis]|uniref:type II toxin-antitoxin system RelE/ParE family toxin n=1 Tax=Paenalcaligenes niemegkensis TaxID=2895469 RepID=UPI001EE89FDA|nr:type II toxin-antitoxin system RelE/ParE family toxin [Paenalcaligenes niemegkensis]MCQ9617277.1 type II toxin-antitoxin system RelE/ParE family toxin [Paenalcaligenes niemegkensis]